jgi:hypothetical protein
MVAQYVSEKVSDLFIFIFFRILHRYVSKTYPMSIGIGYVSRYPIRYGLKYPCFIVRMTPFEALYGRRCRTPVNWIEPGERMIFSSDFVIEDEEIVHHIQSNLKAAKARQDSYANKRRMPLEFEAGNRVYLRVSSTRGVKWFRITGKLAPRYIGPFLILARLWNVTYRLELPPALVGVHNAFYVSQLKKC